MEDQAIHGLTMKVEKQQSRFVLCVRNDESDDLEARKIYQVVKDRASAQEGYLRVIDESGEDYLYPAEYFVPVRLPAAVASQFASPSKAAHGRSMKPRLRTVHS